MSRPTGRGLVIVPAHNEERNIRGVVEGLRRHAPDLSILVVNDGSMDNTVSVLEELNVDFVSLPYNIGYGAALQTGFKYALQEGFDFVVQCDGDGQHDPAFIAPLVSALRSTNADIVIGSRFLNKDGGYSQSLSRSIGISIFRYIARLTAGAVITDITSGFQALSRRAFSRYAAKDAFPRDFPDADVLISMALSGFVIREVPVRMRERVYGVSMHGGLKSIVYVAKMFLSIFIIVLRKATIR